jgi:hypothetical protein
MKRTFLTLLISALGVWGYVLVQIVMALSGKIEADTQNANDFLPAAVLLIHTNAAPDTSFRDPFQSYLYSQKPTPPATKQIIHVAPILISPPIAVINGILGGNPPMAILKQADKTELVKPGDDVWDFKVIRIGANEVIVKKQGREFTLGY